MLSFAVLGFLSIGSVLAAPTARSNYAVKDTHNVPRGWTRISDAPGDHRIELSISVKQSQFDELERHLNESMFTVIVISRILTYIVSNPFHDRYGQHLTAEEVNELVKPSDETSQLVHEWLESNGVSTDNLKYTPAKDWITITLPVAQIESLLDTKYSVYEHEEGGYIVRTSEWSLPSHLHEHIETIQPTNSFFRAKAQKKTFKPVVDAAGLVATNNIFSGPLTGSSAAAVCNTSNITPTCLRTLYGTIDYTPKVPGVNKIGLNGKLLIYSTL